MQSRREYLLTHPMCEYTLCMGARYDPFKWAHQRRPRQVLSTEVDHIWGRRGPKDAVEHPSNYMAANHIPHMWKTDNDVAGRIVALNWKWRQRNEEPDGWDLERMRSVFGKNVLGWLEYRLDTLELPDWVIGLGQEILDEQSGQGSEG